jgi:predicted DNA-binding protein (MmcQ/YjbR family)
MYEDDDPFLQELREICLALPEAIEKETWGRPTFRAGKIFAMFTPEDEHPYALTFKPEAEEQAALAQDSRFFVPRYWGPYGWLSLDFSAASVDWAEVAELVESSYRQIAIKRMLAALDSRSL